MPLAGGGGAAEAVVAGITAKPATPNEAAKAVTPAARRRVRFDVDSVTLAAQAAGRCPASVDRMCAGPLPHPGANTPCAAPINYRHTAGTRVNGPKGPKTCELLTVYRPGRPASRLVKRSVGRWLQIVKGGPRPRSAPRAGCALSRRSVPVRR